jgi:hypothetical protein
MLNPYSQHASANLVYLGSRICPREPIAERVL